MLKCPNYKDEEQIKQLPRDKIVVGACRGMQIQRGSIGEFSGSNRTVVAT